MKITSFSYRYGGPPNDPNLEVIDCRDLINPHSEYKLRPLDGRFDAVRDFILKHDAKKVTAKIGTAISALGQGKNVAFGCFGGRHRSVCLAEMTAEDAASKGLAHEVTHLALEG